MREREWEIVDRSTFRKERRLVDRWETDAKPRSASIENRISQTISLSSRYVTLVASTRTRRRNIDCRQSSGTIERRDLRAIKTPWDFSGVTVKTVDNVDAPWISFWCNGAWTTWPGGSFGYVEDCTGWFRGGVEDEMKTTDPTGSIERIFWRINSETDGRGGIDITVDKIMSTL